MKVVCSGISLQTVSNQVEVSFKCKRHFLIIEMVENQEVITLYNYIAMEYKTSTRPTFFLRTPHQSHRLC
jgi:hypothetical protein